jgi:hypothetical protein
MRVDSAVNTDRLFGRILAQATMVLFKQARRDGLPEGLPICLGGKPSYALPYFGPSAQGRLGALGIMSYMRPSVIDERGLNANLIGAAVLAEKTWAARGLEALSKLPSPGRTGQGSVHSMVWQQGPAAWSPGDDPPVQAARGGKAR